MARSREQNRRANNKSGAGAKGTNSQADNQKAIKQNLKELIEAEKEKRMYQRFLAQSDVERIMSVGDWKTYERQLERNFEQQPKGEEKPRPKPKLTKLNKEKTVKNPI